MAAKNPDYKRIPGRVSVAEAYTNARVKKYPDGSMSMLVASEPLFPRPGIEAERDDISSERELKGGTDVPRSQRRARAQLRDIALSTPFEYFVTLTLDKAKVNRYDMAEITKKLTYWLDDKVRRKGLTYVIVPERHKDGAIHFHGLFNGALKAEYSGMMQPPAGEDGKRPKPRRILEKNVERREADDWLAIYNLPGWTLGFTSAVKLYGDYSKAVNYVCKYIGKDNEKIGGRWFYSGGDIKKPEVILLDAANFDDIAEQEGAYRFDVPGVAVFVQIAIPAAGRIEDERGANCGQRGNSDDTYEYSPGRRLGWRPNANRFGTAESDRLDGANDPVMAGAIC